MPVPDPSRRRHVALVVVLGALVIGACSNDHGPELVVAEATPTAEPTPEPEPTPTALPPTPVPTAPPTATPTEAPIADVERGVDGDTIRIGVIKTGSVYGDVETGVAARLARLVREGGVAGRTVDLVAVLDDRGDPERSLRQARRLVEEERVFAVVHASVAAGSEVPEYLADQAVPFFGWGVSSGFCAPNDWGFGFNGCLIGRALGIEGAGAETSTRDLLRAYLGEVPEVVLVRTPGPAGDTAETLAREVWGRDLAGVAVYTPDTDDPGAEVLEIIDEVGPDAVVVATGLGDAIEVKGLIVPRFPGPVVDQVTYLPGLLGDFTVAAKLEGGFAVTQFPPQEEYREVTGVVASDIDAVGANLIYSNAVNLGYWSTDLFIALVDAVGEQLTPATFHEVVNVSGVDYEPGFGGAPCPINTLDIHTDPAGGAALLQVQGGIYRPVVQFTC